MELYVKMTDEELLEYQDYIKHKEEYVKLEDISIEDILKRNFVCVKKYYYQQNNTQETLYRNTKEFLEIIVKRRV